MQSIFANTNQTEKQTKNDYLCRQNMKNIIFQQQQKSYIFRMIPNKQA